MFLIGQDDRQPSCLGEMDELKNVLLVKLTQLVGIGA